MYKQVILVRKDLDWKKGKLASHVAHAAVGSALKVEKNVYKMWEKSGSKKVVLKVGSLNELQDIYKKVKKLNLPCFLVKDAGLTQLKKGTITSLGIGPVKEKVIDRITGKLKLL